MQIEHCAPWLIADTGSEMRLVSWAPHRPGFVDGRRVVWREVRNADLTRDFDATAWLTDELANEGMADAVGLITSRNLASHHAATATAGHVASEALATVGLGNAERVGHRVGAERLAGTINVFACLSKGITDSALLEAISIAAEARTAAVSEVGRKLATGVATGTGTDCIVIAASRGDEAHAGKHTDAGEALGRAVYEAVLAGAREWMSENA